MNTAWSKTTKYIAGVGLVILGVFILYLSRSVIPLLIIAAIIAAIVSPMISWLRRRLRLPLGIALALAYLGLIVLVPLAFVLIVPAVIDALHYVVSLDYEGILQQVTVWLHETLAAIQAVQLPTEALDSYIDGTIESLLISLQSAVQTTGPETPPVDTIVQSLGTALTATFGAAASLIGNVLSSVVLLIFIFLASIYISLNGRDYRDDFLHALPEAYQPEIAMLLARIGSVWNGFFRGQFTLMLLIGVMSWLGLTILGVPGALSLGIIAGLLEIVPNLGPVIATIPAVIVALMQGSTYIPISPLALAGLVILFYVFVQQLENNLIVPRVLGQAVDLPPLAVMTGVLIGGTVAGILGALLASPIVGSAREILRYTYRKMLGKEPFPPEEELKPARPPDVELLQRLNEWKQRVFSKSRLTANPAAGDASSPEEDVDKSEALD